MKNIQNILSTLLLLLIAGSMYGQPLLKQYLDKATEEFKNENYSAVLELATKAAEYETPDEKTTYLIAESARMQFAYTMADQYYTFLIDSLKSTNYKDAYYKLANVKQTLGKYNEAIRYYDLYLAEAEGDDPMLTKKSKTLKSSAAWAAKQERNPAMLDSIAQMEGVNTPYSEHGAYHDGEQFYYTSLRFPKKKDSVKPARLISKVLSGSDDKPYMPIDDNGKFNNDNLLTSGTTLSADKKLMFYSLCQLSKTSQISCNIYYMKMEGDEWANPVKLPEQVNELGSNSTHPSVGMTKDGKTRLYFASNRSTGKGERDIYSVQYDEDMSFSSAASLSDINTPYDDISPFFNPKTSELYFSSNGRDGFGNYDVFKKDASGEISNLGYGINTSYNEIFYSISADENTQYVSSNRPGSMYLNSKFETCCYDIYNITFDKCEIDLLALTYDSVTRADLAGVTLTLKNLTTGLEEDVNLNELGNDFNYELFCDHEYEITAKKEGYHDATIKITKADLDPNTRKPIEKKLYLTPTVLPVELVVNTFEKPTNYDLLEATVVLIDVETGKEVTRISKNATNRFDFKVMQGKSYKLIATKDGYEEVMANISIPTDQEGAFRKDMYLGREAVIESLANLIPLKLYYNNDYPNPRSKQVTTNERYKTTYREYVAKKPQFVETYSNLYKGERKEIAAQEMSEFFDVDMRKGYDKISIFLETLNRILLTGKSVHLYLRGYASPLSQNDYNTALGKRRVDCVRNEFRDYENGILMKYINSKQLQITERSFGETAAPKGISDDPSSPKKSIFSPQASKERRVEIDEIKEVK